MSSKADDYAFPSGELGEAHEAGLSKREAFAALAMAGLSANSDFSQNTERSIVIMAIECADVLLTELNKAEESKPDGN